MPLNSKHSQDQTRLLERLCVMMQQLVDKKYPVTIEVNQRSISRQVQQYRAVLREMGTHGSGKTPVRVLESGEDPRKNGFGSNSCRDGWRLYATVVPVAESAGLCTVRVRAVHVDKGTPGGERVVFYLHPTFTPAEVAQEVVNDVALVERVAWGAFTVGARIEPLGLLLELDLASTEVDAPEDWQQR